MNKTLDMEGELNINETPWRTSVLFFFSWLILSVIGYCIHVGYKQLHSRMIYISLEGNIGSGKSTLLSLLKKKCKKSTLFVDEPVDAWERLTDCDGLNLLQRFYEAPLKYAATFQMVALFTRCMNMNKALTQWDVGSTVISERSINSDRGVFAQMLLQDGYLTSMEYCAYNLMFNWFKTYLKLDSAPLTIFVNTSPSICFRRIQKRSRGGECNINMGYLERLHEQHLKYLSEIPDVIVLNGELPVQDMFQTLLYQCKQRGVEL
jgi:deoxyadenosine/deoxycytidine kinase